MYKDPFCKDLDYRRHPKMYEVRNSPRPICWAPGLMVRCRGSRVSRSLDLPSVSNSLFSFPFGRETGGVGQGSWIHSRTVSNAVLAFRWRKGGVCSRDPFMSTGCCSVVLQKAFKLCYPYSVDLCHFEWDGRQLGSGGSHFMQRRWCQITTVHGQKNVMNASLFASKRAKSMRLKRTGRNRVQLKGTCCTSLHCADIIGS